MGSRYKLFMSVKLVKVAPLPSTVNEQALRYEFRDFKVDQAEIINGAGYLHLLDFNQELMEFTYYPDLRVPKW